MIKFQEKNYRVASYHINIYMENYNTESVYGIVISNEKRIINSSCQISDKSNIELKILDFIEISIDSLMKNMDINKAKYMEVVVNTCNIKGIDNIEKTLRAPEYKYLYDKLSIFYCIKFEISFLSHYIYSKAVDMVKEKIEYLSSLSEDEKIKNIEMSDDTFIKQLNFERNELDKYMDWVERTSSNKYVYELSKHLSRYENLVDKIISGYEKNYKEV